MVGNLTICILILFNLALTMIPAAFSETLQEPLYQRRNFFGMHNLKDGGPSIESGMEATKHLVGNGFVFDWVFDFEPWVAEAFKRNLIPCIRVQEGRGGALLDPGYAGNVAWAILNYKIAHPEYADRLVYLQLWNEPHDQRDKVEPDVYADYLVAAHSAVHQAENEAAASHPERGLEGTFKTMTPGQNGPSWWDVAFTHNPDAKFAFDVWGTHPYPEATPPHYNLHDGDVFIETSKTIDSYLMDLDVVAMPHGNPPRSRRGFPVMITETAYGKKLGISYEGWPKTSRQMAADYNVDAYGNRWYRWPEIIAVHPYILSNWSWRDFEWIDSPSWEDKDGDGIDETFTPYPQYTAVRQLRLDFEAQGMEPARLTPFRGPKGTVKGIIQRADTGEPVPYATVFTDGYEFGNVSLYDGGYEIHDVPAGTYTLAVEKNGYVSAGTQIDVYDGQTATVDFNLIYSGKVSKGIYFVDTFAGDSGCSGCDLFAGFLGQKFMVPTDVGFIKYAACKPNIDDVTMKFSILEGGPFGPRVGSSITATLEPGDGAIMIGAEWPDGQEPAVVPGNTYFLKVERADGQSIYCFASESNPYADGNAYVAGTSHPGWDLYAVIRGLTHAENLARGNIAGTVNDIWSEPITQAMIVTIPGGYYVTSDDSGQYGLDNLPTGTYSLSASKAGYLKGIQSDVEVNSGETTIVNMSLQPIPIVTPQIDNPDFEADGGFFRVARGWNPFGGNKWESVWDPERVFTQRVADISPGGIGGIYQKVLLTPGASYRVSVYAKTTTLNYEVAIGVDPAGGIDPNFAVFGDGSTSAAWTQLVVEFTAGESEATIFLSAQNTGSWSYGKWAQFDGVTVELLGTDNSPPIAVVSASPMEGFAPLTVQFDGTGSSDPDGEALSYEWDFGDGTSHRTEPITSHIFPNAGTYVTTLTVDDGKGGSDSDTVTISVEEISMPSNLIANGDFANGLAGWSVWIERGTLNPGINDAGQLQVQSSNHNGGVYQQFQTGGTGTLITVNGFWASNPTLPEHQWSEVLIINSDRIPVNWSDTHAGQSDVVLIYKNDTWHSNARNGWNGLMNDTAVVANTGSFEANDDVATIVLKSGNMGGATAGTRFDDISVAVESAPPDPDNRDPNAVASATPTKGEPPLSVDFDGSGSSDPDGDGLTFKWDFGDGHQGSGIGVSHTYNTAGIYQAIRSVDDGNGGMDTDAVFMHVGQSNSSGKSKLTIHTSFLGPASWWFLEQAQPTVVKILDEIKVEVTQAVKDKSPHTLIVGRIWYDAWQRLGQGSPEARALEW
jgi:PKD repeat protein